MLQKEEVSIRQRSLHHQAKPWDWARSGALLQDKTADPGEKDRPCWCSVQTTGSGQRWQWCTVDAHVSYPKFTDEETGSEGKRESHELWHELMGVNLATSCSQPQVLGRLGVHIKLQLFPGRVCLKKCRKCGKNMPPWINCSCLGEWQS